MQQTNDQRATQRTIAEQLRDVRLSWSEFGETDPLWAVLTEDHGKDGNWDIREFFQRGIADVRHVIFTLLNETTLGNRFQKRQHDKQALDFGCGVGRLTAALSKYFGRVVGADISLPMLAKARQLEREHPELYTADTDILYLPVVGRTISDRIMSGTFDFVLSLITLQHNPAVMQLSYISQFIDALTPGGIAVFQCMLPPLLPVYNAPHEPGKPVMQMHGVPMEQVIRIVRESHGRILHIQYDKGQSEWSPAWISFIFYVEKLA